MENQRYIVDCNVDPVDVLRVNLVLLEHRKGGQIVFSTDAVTLWRHPDQLLNGSIESDKLQGEMHPGVANATILDFLLSHGELIPEVWKGLSVYFWGTTYRYPGSQLAYVRFLTWHEYINGWVWGYRGVSGYFHEDCPALVM